jgi:hypothetical protein
MRSAPCAAELRSRRTRSLEPRYRLHTQLLGVKGESNSGMYKATIGRTAKHHGKTIGKQMGVNTWAAFAGTDEMASVDGDFAMVKSELQEF